MRFSSLGGWEAAGAGAGAGDRNSVWKNCLSDAVVIREILGLPKRQPLGTIPMYLSIHLVLADLFAYSGGRLNLVSLRKTRII